jgi:uncharacterized damage-inducible protein DinB
MKLDRLFLDFSAGKLQQLSSRVETCLLLLDDEEVWTRGSDAGNAVGNLVLHLCGNVGQWIVSGAGEAPDIRDRDSEFAARSGPSKEELAANLSKTVAKAIEVIRSLPAGRLEERVRIQGYDVSVMEAIYHSVEHLSMHTGQIIFATKLFAKSDLAFYRGLGAERHPGSKP